MAKKPSALAGIFDEEPAVVPAPAPLSSQVADPEEQKGGLPRTGAGRAKETAAPARKNSHPGKKPVLIHIPEDMHRTLRQLSVEEGGEPLTVITERMLRQYLVQRGHTKFAP